VALLCTLLGPVACTEQSPIPPLASGRYIFQHRFAEQPTLPSVPLVVLIDGRHIVITNETESSAFPKGVMAEGTIMWHSASKSWIIGTKAGDSSAPEVGGCTDGPEVIDFHSRIFWTC